MNPFKRQSVLDPRRWSNPAAPSNRTAAPSNALTAPGPSLGRRLSAPLPPHVTRDEVKEEITEISEDEDISDVDCNPIYQENLKGQQQQQRPTPNARVHRPGLLDMPPIAGDAASTAAASSSSVPKPPVVKRSSYVSGLSLHTSQLGPAAGSRGGAGAGGRRAAGTHGTLVQRAQAEVQSAAQVLLVKHRILGPVPPTTEALLAALADAELSQCVLRLCRVHHAAPLVIAECEIDASYERSGSGSENGNGESSLRACNDDDGGGEDGDTESSPLPHSVIRLAMARTKFDRVFGGGAYVSGARIVIFSPWVEYPVPQDGGGPPLLTILATHAEALPAA